MIAILSTLTPTFHLTVVHTLFHSFANNILTQKIFVGRNAVLRLLHIADRCPTLTREALALALRHIKQLRDTSLYQAAINMQANFLSASGHAPAIDDSWIQQLNSKNQTDRNKLEVELKTYQSNMIKESIRVS